jgi:DNA-binding transcriptional LysR family regulator
MDTLLCMRSFAKVAEAGSFAGAARVLNLSPSTVTKHLHHLERRVGARLFSRNTRRVALTEAGAVYWRHCRDLLAEIEQAEAEVGGMAQSPRGQLRIAAAYDFGVSQIEPAILDFTKEHPDITIDLSLGSQFVDLVKDEFDMAVRIAGQKGLDASLIARRLATSRLVVCGAPDYLQGLRPQAPADLARHNCLVYTGAAWRDEWPFTCNGSIEKVTLSGNIRSNDNLLLCRAAVAGFGLTIQPSFNVWRELRSGQLETVLDGWQVDELGVFVIFPHRQLLPAKVRAFVDFLGSRFRNSPDQDIWLEKAKTLSHPERPTRRTP